GTQACAYALAVLAWWLLGWAALNGRADAGWLLAGQLLLLLLVPLGMVGASAGGLLPPRAAGPPEGRRAGRVPPSGARRGWRRGGGGVWLGQVLETEAIEVMGLTGGLAGLTALVELAMAGCVLGAGAGGGTHIVLLLGTSAAAVLLGLRYYRHRVRWTDDRQAQ